MCRVGSGAAGLGESLCFNTAAGKIEKGNDGSEFKKAAEAVVRALEDGNDGWVEGNESIGVGWGLHLNSEYVCHVC